VPSPPTDDNPYAAPLSQTGQSDALGRGAENREALHVPWALVFLGNLIAPMMFGWGTTGSGGHVGIILAVVLLWWLGYHFVATYRMVRGPLLAGGLCVGLSQVFPLIHMMAGIVGVGLASKVFHEGPPGQHPDLKLTHLTEPGAFLATLVTGAQLMVAAWVFGLLLRTILRALGWPEDGRDEPLPAI
jgi:hypothetical protein